MASAALGTASQATVCICRWQQGWRRPAGPPCSYMAVSGSKRTRGLGKTRRRQCVRWRDGPGWHRRHCSCRGKRASSPCGSRKRRHALAGCAECLLGKLQKRVFDEESAFEYGDSQSWHLQLAIASRGGGDVERVGHIPVGLCLPIHSSRRSLFNSQPLQDSLARPGCRCTLRREEGGRVGGQAVQTLAAATLSRQRRGCLCGTAGRSRGQSQSRGPIDVEVEVGRGAGSVSTAGSSSAGRTTARLSRNQFKLARPA